MFQAPFWYCLEGNDVGNTVQGSRNFLIEFFTRYSPLNTSLIQISIDMKGVIR